MLGAPILYHMSDERSDNLVAELKSIGLVVSKPSTAPTTLLKNAKIPGLASKYDLKISGGSHFHGANKPKIDLGTGRASRMCRITVLENLRRGGK